MDAPNTDLASRIAGILKEAPVGSATRQLVNWHGKELEKGMTSINVTGTSGVTHPEQLSDTELASVIEEHAAEFMRMVNAPTVPDRELL
ncbi:MAG: hypothetical protein RLZZ347_182 [Candidatus Parcubacteria bacterium]